MAARDVVINMPLSAHDMDHSYEKPKAGAQVSIAELNKTSTSFSSCNDNHQAHDVRATETSLVAYDGEVDTLKWLGRVYDKISRFSIITRYFLYIIPIALVLAIPLIISATAASDAHIGKTRLMGLFVWLETIWCGVWIAKLGVKMLPYVFKFFCQTLSAGVRKHAKMIEALEVPLSVVIWIVICWASVPIISAFNDNSNRGASAQWISVLENILLAAIPSTCVLLVEKFFIQLITISYHRKQLNSRINESKYMVGILERLYIRSLRLYPIDCPKFAKLDPKIKNSLVTSSITKNQLFPSNSPLAFFDGLEKIGTGVTSVFGSMANEVTGTQSSEQSEAHQVVVWALEHKSSSKALATRLWSSFIEEGHEALFPHDLEKVFETEDAEVIFNSFDKNHNGDISLDEMTMMVTEIGRSREAITKSMYDVNMAISCLDKVLLIIVLIAVALIYGAFFSKNFTKSVGFLTTTVLSLSFAFAVTVQEFTGSCIFLFVKHPYDIDDRVDINGQRLIVEHIELLYTVFRRIDNNKTVQIPNIVNNSNWIENVTRSGAMKEQVSISVHAGTSFDDIKILRKLLQDFVASPENKRDFFPKVDLDINAVGDLKAIELVIEFTHKSNWSNESLRLARRARLMCALVGSVRSVPIYAPGGGEVSLGDAAKPTYSISFTEAEALNAKEKASQAKEEKRLYPSDQSKAAWSSGVSMLGCGDRDKADRW